MSDLRRLDAIISKHSQYQEVPPDSHEATSVTRRPHYESERFQFIRDRIALQDRSVIDIGANQGAFSFQCLREGARSVAAIEGNEAHAEFIRRRADACGVSDRLTVENRYVDFRSDIGQQYDVGLVLNVIHHRGEDYGGETSLANALEGMARDLNSMAGFTEMLIMQMGFNWRGDVSKPLFTRGRSFEMYDFVVNSTAGVWDLYACGVATRTSSSTVTYSEAERADLRRDDAMGEFLNRPLFLLNRVG